jgi:hypothetical protein
LATPEVDAACHALAIFHSLATQPVDYGEASNPVMAENHKRRTIVIQALQVLWNGAHRDQAGTFNSANRMFFRLAHIDQPDRHALVHEIL